MLDRADWQSVRSLLFVPATNERALQGAHRRGADAIILDLEDSVAPSAKDHARRAIGPAVDALAARRIPVAVRINAITAGMIDADLAAAIRPGLAAIIVPKVESADDIEHVASAIDRAERERSIPAGTTAILATVETPKGLLACERIAQWHERVTALMFGPEDFSAAMGIAPTVEALMHPAQRLAIAAHAGQIAALGVVGSAADLEDTASFRRLVEISRAIGMTGTGCIHPTQVQIVNAVFRPDAQAIEKAREICSAYERALADGVGAIRFDGRMIDEPVYQRALALLNRVRLETQD